MAIKAFIIDEIKFKASFAQLRKPVSVRASVIAGAGGLDYEAKRNVNANLMQTIQRRYT